MKENFPNLVMDIDNQGVQEAQRVPKIGPKEEHTKAHHNYIIQIRGKERILKAARQKETVTYKGVLIRLSADSQKKPCRQEGAEKKYLKS